MDGRVSQLESEQIPRSLRAPAVGGPDSKPRGILRLDSERASAHLPGDASWLVWMFQRRSLKPIVKQLDPKKVNPVPSMAQLPSSTRTVDKEIPAVARSTTRAGLLYKALVDQ